MLGCSVYLVSYLTHIRKLLFTILYLTGCSHGSIRLRDSTGSMNGRVEVCLNGDWGTVCHDRWSTVDSNIACRQLGFSNSGIFPLCVNFIIVYVATYQDCLTLDPDGT